MRVWRRARISCSCSYFIHIIKYICFHCKRIICRCVYKYFSPIFFSSKKKIKPVKLCLHLLAHLLGLFFLLYLSDLSQFCTFLQLWNWNHDLALSFVHRSIYDDKIMNITLHCSNSFYSPMLFFVRCGFISVKLKSQIFVWAYEGVRAHQPSTCQI